MLKEFKLVTRALECVCLPRQCCENDSEGEVDVLRVFDTLH
jgi:hypothetical protein